MITYRPVAYEPVELAPDVHLVRQACSAAGDESTVYMSSLVIKGREPGDVRWVFISHDDVDTSGSVGSRPTGSTRGSTTA